MEALNICYQLLFVLYYIAYLGANSTCAPGLNTPGVTVPKGDIKIEYGNPLEIFCILDPSTKANSSSLVFYHNDVRVPDQFLTIVNETTLRLYVEKPPISESLYSCKLLNKNEVKGVCLNYVYVGTKPKEVNNFTCISYNWESLNCSWTPVKNPVHTTYRLSFYLHGKTRKVYPCPDKSNDHNFCLWNSTTTPPHRMPYAVYYFHLSGENDFGNFSKIYKVNHYAVVLPRKPENLSLIQATPSSLTISWTLPLALKEFPVEIKNKVMYQSRWDPLTYWQEVDTSNIIKNGEQRILNITGLKYAHTLYDIRVLLRSVQAEDIEKWWSEPATITIRTRPTVPGMPPKTVVGSFESTPRASDPDHRNIFIYWQLIPQKLENGENFGYNISSIEEIVDGKRILRNNTPIMYKYYALFKKMTYNTYIFKIVSSNKEGTSQSYSTIVVPSKAGSPDHPVSFKKIAYDHGVFELSWNAPPHNNVSSHNDITSYTIFWCDNKYDRPYGCNGVLNWTVVSNNVTEKNITLTEDKAYQFAISANTINSSSGMMWAHCTVFPDQERGKLKNIWINRIGSNYMELGWKLECITSSINGFVVEYCPVPNPKQPECKNEDIERRRFSGDQYTSRYNISDLQPYTTYKVHLSLVSGDSLISSDALLNTTLEAAPDGPPEQFKALVVTNTSVALSWRKPSALNGVLRHYEIYWNTSRTLIENKSDVVQFTLNHLLSYEDYVIKVTACTVACSNKSATITVRTRIGFPGQLPTPAVTYYNKTDFNITWFPLKHRRGGRNDYYQIKIEMLNEQKDIVNNETIKRFNNTGGMVGKDDALEILTPGCQEADSSTVYRVQVRAVNEDTESPQVFEGPWSLPAEGFCHANTLSLQLPSILLLSAVGILLALVLCAIVGYLTRCIWRRCKAMQNIRVKLPPQLELDIYKDKVIDLPMAAHVCSPQLKPLNSDNNDSPPPPDQQLLLENKDKEELVESSTEDNEDGSGDRESSGCGSGHESVSSSITAGTHVTDSGTEADEVSMLADIGGHQRTEISRNQQDSIQRYQRPEDVFSDSPRREIYPRQRNVPRSGSGGDGYCILAQAPSGYVSLPPMSNYVKHDWTPNAPIKAYDINGSIASPNGPSGRPPSNETSWAS